MPDDPQVLAGRYELGRLLGKGGMGRVHVARDRTLERDVAVKLLASAAPEPETLHRFQREALAAGSVQHPNVVAVFDAGEEQGRPFIVTELLLGATLREKLKAGPLPVREALRIARQVAEGLAAAHEKGLTHRDLKPENIFITGDGWVKILDFGLVKLTEALRAPPGDTVPDAENASTGAGRMLGTVGYMAPEQVRGRPVDPRTDLFNLGAVLYEMLSGKRAFRGESPTETGYATLFKEPEPLPASVPRETRELIARCLKKEPADRFATARDFLAALDGKPARRPSPRVGKRTWLSALAFTVAIGVLFVAIPRLKRDKPRALGPPPSGSVAILPFGARDAPKFAWLSEGVVDLLARDLKSTELRVVDSASVLRAIGGDVTADLDKVRGASAQLGAKYFVLGRIEERKGELVLEAVLHTGDAGQVVTQGLAQGDPAQLLKLIRQLSDQLQSRPLPKQEFAARLEILARQTSRSVPALQAWLEGEEFVRRGHWSEAVSALHRAATFDPEFALAQYRLGVIAESAEPGMADDALSRALRHGDRLGPSERMLLLGRIAMQEGRFGEAENAFREASRRYSDDPQTWMELAELLFHQNPLRARSPQESVDALQHVLVLDPVNTEAMQHLLDLAMVAGERAVAARLADRLLGLIDDPALVVANRVVAAWSQNAVEDGERVISGLLKPGTLRSLIDGGFSRALWLGQFDASTRLARDSTGSDDSESRAWSSYLKGVVALASGRPQSAREELGRAAQLAPSGNAAWRLPWVSTLEFFPVTGAQLTAARAAAEQLDSLRGGAQPQKTYLIGALAARAGDEAGAERAAQELERLPILEGSTITADLALAVRARARAARREFGAALALLEQQRLRIPARYVPNYRHLAEVPLRAALLAETGRTREALQVLDALDVYSGLDPIFAPPAHLAKARIYDKADDREAAIEHYAKFVELWKDCEPALRPEVEAARSRLAQLKQAGQRASR